MEARYSYILPVRLAFSLLVTTHIAAQGFSSLPRWGQATAVINTNLFVHGGKTDQFNSFSYTSAYTNNDLIYLDLSQSFDPSSPPWQYIAGSDNASTPQGPILAWHSFSAYNTSQLLIFGGDGGPNSPVVLPDRADSASILDIRDTFSPGWISEAPSWAGEPLRRIHHSVSTSYGKVYLVGGEKDDGSSLGLSDHYVFDPSVPSFTQLPSENGPQDIYGHASLVLSNGQLLVFGGYSPSQSDLIPFSTIWTMDTAQQSPSWSTVSVSSSSLPSPRRAFSATLLENDQVLVYGGADAVLQNSYSDGWILDTTQTPMTWSSVSELSQLGPRRDHFSITVGSQVIFGFGYAQNSAATAALSVFDTKNGVFLSSFIPSAIPSQTTLSPPSSTDPSSKGIGSSDPGPGHGSSSGGGSLSKQGTSTAGGSAASGSLNNTNGSNRRNSNTLEIALGTVFACLALLAAFLLLFLRNRRRGHFRRIRGDENDPILGQSEKSVLDGNGWLQQVPRKTWNILTIGSRNARHNHAAAAAVPPRRFNILADEDERDFDVRSFSVFREGSGSSRSWYTGRGHSERSGSGDTAGRSSLWGSVISRSLNSFRDVGVTIKKSARKASGSTHPESSGNPRSNAWWDENLAPDPFSDGVALLRPDSTSSTGALENDFGAASRLRDGLGSSSNYIDPFADQDSSTNSAIRYAISTECAPFNNDRDSVANLVQTDDTTEALPTLSNASSYKIAADRTSSVQSHETRSISPSNGTRVTNSDSSAETVTVLAPSMIRPRASSIIGASTAQAQPVRRSDSWWARFRRTSFKEFSQEVVKSPSHQQMEFRDPNPAPRLVSIREASNSLSPTSPESSGSHRSTRLENINRNIYNVSGHERSMSSLKTAKTADSEAIERMATGMDVVQRTGTHSSGPSSDSGSASHGPSHRILQSIGQRFADISVSESLRSSVVSDESTPSIDRALVESPRNDLSLSGDWDLTDIYQHSMARRATRGKVAPRVAEIELRVKESESAQSSPVRRDKYSESSEVTPTLRKEGGPISYGLVQRPELVITNPDRGSGSSS